MKKARKLKKKRKKWNNLWKEFHSECIGSNTKEIKRVVVEMLNLKELDTKELCIECPNSAITQHVALTIASELILAEFLGI